MFKSHVDPCLSNRTTTFPLLKMNSLPYRKFENRNFHSLCSNWWENNGIEPTTSGLQSRCSPTERHPSTLGGSGRFELDPRLIKTVL